MLNQAAPADHPLKKEIVNLAGMLDLGFAQKLTARRLAQADKPMRLGPGGHLGIGDPLYPHEGSLALQSIKEKGIKNALLQQFSKYLTPAARNASWEQIASALNTYFEKSLGGA